MLEFKESKFYKLLQDFFINNNKETFLQVLAEFYNRTEGIINKNEVQDEIIKELREMFIKFNEEGIDENVVIEKVNYFVENNVKIQDIIIKLLANTNNIEQAKTELNTKAKKGKNIKIIAKENGDFTLPSECIEAGGDTIENPLTMIIHPGTYEDQVYIRQWSRINMIGTNKKDCIIVNHGGGYTDEPLITAGERYIANLTFRATHDKTTIADKTQWKAYAFHGDKSSGGDGTTLIENCRFESFQNASVGLGIYNNQTFHFKNCEFYSKIDWDSPQANLGAFFAHNNVNGGETNGKLILENCTFFMDNDRAGYGHACYINDANLTKGNGEGNAINVLFINCTLQRNVGGFVNALRVDNSNSIGKLSGSIELNICSNGNNISQLNSPQTIWHDVTLTSPIQNLGSNFTPLRYSKNIDGKVRIEGTIKGLVSGSANNLFTLPIGYRPKYHMFFDIVNYEGSNVQIGKILVNRNGEVSIEGTLNTNKTNICIEFYAEQ